MQRVFDILFAGSAFLLLLPLFLITALILRMTGEKEVFYVQQRVGKNGRLFGLYKFVTMLRDSPNIGTGTITVKNDPRVLPFGRLLRRSKINELLRRSKINELPQLFNTLKGDMSLIGPRPQTPRCFGVFPEDHQEAIKQVAPGLSGIGSIVFSHEDKFLDGKEDALGYYDEVIAPYKGMLEKWYVQHQSVGIYFKLIGLTILVVLTGKRDIVWKVLPDLPPRPDWLV